MFLIGCPRQIILLFINFELNINIFLRFYDVHLKVSLLSLLNSSLFVQKLNFFIQYLSFLSSFAHLRATPFFNF